ncbi:MAG TPA: hypothetical protein VHO24_11860 [Opitutaceae bacterium]|nr:hypothetical protein [Opitutaceae bacterium]
MRFHPLAAAILLGAVSWSRAAEAPAFPQREVREIAGFKIEYSPGDEAYADVLAQRLSERANGTPAAAETSRLDGTQMSRRREELLGKVTAWLALPKPTAELEKTYDNFGELFGILARTMPKDPRNYALWRRPELLARLQAGEKIPGFVLSGPTGIEFKFAFNLEKAKDETQEALGEKAAKFWEAAVLPISIGKEPDHTPGQDIAEGLEVMTGAMSHLRDVLIKETAGPFIILHETVEVGIITAYLASKDRRWFCDGVANYVAWKILADTLGAEDARRYYDLDAQLAQYAGEAGRIDLAKWPAGENAVKANYSENLNTANYAFATKVIADICGRHGDAILPKLFAEIGKTPKDKATIKTVYTAFKKLTGEDMRRYLPKPGAKK